MLTLLEITNSSSDTLQLPMTDSSAGYVVKEIDGLDPVNATLTSSSIAQVDGAQPQNARRDTRNITIKLGFDPDYVTNTVQSLRSDLYDYFMPKANIQLGFYIDDALYVITSGQVESFENAMFSDDPEVDISVICYDPDFYAPASETVSGNTTSDTNVNTITYEGSTDAGVIFTLSLNADITGFAIYNTRPDNTIQVMTFGGTTFASGSTITICTIPGSKSIIYNNLGDTSSLLTWMDPTSTWISLGKGDNDFRAAYSGSPIPYTVEYTAKFGAI